MLRFRVYMEAPGFRHGPRAMYMKPTTQIAFSAGVAVPAFGACAVAAGPVTTKWRRRRRRRRRLNE
jgi:hypothetical protein